jgi:hypothetical protein
VCFCFCIAKIKTYKLDPGLRTRPESGSSIVLLTLSLCEKAKSTIHDPLVHKLFPALSLQQQGASDLFEHSKVTGSH